MAAASIATVLYLGTKHVYVQLSTAMLPGSTP